MTANPALLTVQPTYDQVKVIFDRHGLAVAVPKITLVKFFHHFIHAVAGRLMSTDMDDLTDVQPRFSISTRFFSLLFLRGYLDLSAWSKQLHGLINF